MLNNNFQNILIKFCLWLATLFAIIFVGVTDVFAYTYEDIGYFNSNSQVQVEVSYNDSPLTLNINNEYYLENVYSLDIHVSNINLSQDYVYWFEIYLPQTSSINANASDVTWYGDNNTTGSCTILTTYFSNNYPHVTFKCNGSTNIKELYIRYYNSSNDFIISSSGNYFKWNYTYMRRRTPDSNDNTGNITDSIQQNTQDIINNQNQNTQDMIDSQKVCKKEEISGSLLAVTLGNNPSPWYRLGDSNTGIEFNISNYQGKNITLEFNNLNNNFNPRANYCFGINKVQTNNQVCLLSSITTTPTQNAKYTLTVPNNANYLYIIGYINNNNKIELLDQVKLTSEEICKNGNQALDDSINNLNDNLNDDDSSGATGEASDFFEGFTTNTFGLTSIITAPLNLIQSLTSSTCTQLHLPLPYLDHEYLDLPCMTSIYQQYFGSFFTMYQTITYGIIAYWVIVRIFNQVKDFKNPEHDEIEVVDL